MGWVTLGYLREGWPTSDLKDVDINNFLEVDGELEGERLLDWPLDWSDIFSIHEALLIAPECWGLGIPLPKHGGKPPGPDLKAAPFSFGVVAPTGDNGISFPIRMIFRVFWLYNIQMENYFNLSYAFIEIIYSTIYLGCFFLYAI